MTAPARLLRGRVLTLSSRPTFAGERAHRYFDNGAALVANGRILAAGDAADV